MESGKFYENLLSDEQIVGKENDLRKLTEYTIKKTIQYDGNVNVHKTKI